RQAAESQRALLLDRDDFERGAALLLREPAAREPRQARALERAEAPLDRARAEEPLALHGVLDRAGDRRVQVALGRAGEHVARLERGPQLREHLVHEAAALGRVQPRPRRLERLDAQPVQREGAERARGLVAENAGAARDDGLAGALRDGRTATVLEALAAAGAPHHIAQVGIMRQPELVEPRLRKIPDERARQQIAVSLAQRVRYDDLGGRAEPAARQRGVEL